MHQIVARDLVQGHNDVTRYTLQCSCGEFSAAICDTNGRMTTGINKLKGYLLSPLNRI